MADDITSFADREFYQDWWNSTTWDQFSRKWNKPVHVSRNHHKLPSTDYVVVLDKMLSIVLDISLTTRLCIDNVRPPIIPNFGDIHHFSPFCPVSRTRHGRSD